MSLRYQLWQTKVQTLRYQIYSVASLYVVIERFLLFAGNRQAVQYTLCQIFTSLRRNDFKSNDVAEIAIFSFYRPMTS